MKNENNNISPLQVVARITIAILFALPMLIRWLWQYQEDYQKEDAQLSRPSDPARLAA